MKKRLMLFGLLLVMMVCTQFLFVDQAEGTKIYNKKPDGFPTTYYGTPACRQLGTQCWTSNGVGPGTGAPVGAQVGSGEGQPMADAEEKKDED